MKKLLYSILLGLLVMIPANVFAGSIAPSTGSISVQQGGSTSFSIVASNAIGDVIVTSSNPSVATVSPGSWATGAIGSGQTLSGRFTVTGVGVGTTTITVVIDGYAFDNGGYDVSGTRTITVNVTAPPPPAPTPSTPATPTLPSNPTPSTPAAPTGPEDTRSTNANLNKLTINGKDIANTNNVYTLEVGNYVDKADISAVVADSKAKITSGTGKVDLKVGENNFNVVISAERGNTATYIVKIIRKEYNILKDLDELLKLNKDVEIRVDEKDKLSKEQLDKIIKIKKKYTLTRMSLDGKQVLYSFILDGSKIKSANEFNLNISNVLEDNHDMEEALNYADGIYIDFSKCGDIPKGVVLRYYVGTKYKDSDKVNLYVYSGNKVTQLEENLSIKDGYIEFEITDTIRHFISKAKVINAEVKDKINIWFIVSMILIGVIIIGGILVFISKSKKTIEKKTATIDEVPTATIDVSNVINNTKEEVVPKIVETQIENNNLISNTEETIIQNNVDNSTEMVERKDEIL